MKIKLIQHLNNNLIFDNSFIKKNLYLNRKYNNNNNNNAISKEKELITNKLKIIKIIMIIIFQSMCLWIKNIKKYGEIFN